jgi:hypothetical protein
MFLTSVQAGQARMTVFFFTPHAKPENAKMQKKRFWEFPNCQNSKKKKIIGFLYLVLLSSQKYKKIL